VVFSLFRQHQKLTLGPESPHTWTRWFSSRFTQMENSQKLPETFIQSSSEMGTDYLGSGGPQWAPSPGLCSALSQPRPWQAGPYPAGLLRGWQAGWHTGTRSW
jgi:hypothetical protein